MGRPRTTRRALSGGPLCKAVRADPARVERVPGVITLTAPEILGARRPSAYRTADIASAIAARFPCFDVQAGARPLLDHRRTVLRVHLTSPLIPDHSRESGPRAKFPCRGFAASRRVGMSYESPSCNTLACLPLNRGRHEAHRKLTGPGSGIQSLRNCDKLAN
jgi:hypothetical protein